MATKSISSLLGLSPPPPVLSPSSVEKRLSKLELRVATAAFHRARGYGDRIDFPRFRDTILQEAFPTMPLYVMQRLFAVWNYSETSTGGALGFKEFLVGVTIVWRGSKEEHLKFVFQLMDRHGDQELTKRDALAFCRAVARKNGTVAGNDKTEKQWSVEEFVAKLFPTESATLTPAAFVKAVTCLQTTWLAIVDWIPKLASQFEKDKEKVSAVTHPTTSSSLSNEVSKEQSTQTTDGLTEAAPSPTSRRTIEQVEEDPQMFEIEVISPDQFHTIKMAVHALIEVVLTSSDFISDYDIQERLRGVLPEAVRVSTLRMSEMCAGDFVLSRVQHGENTVGETKIQTCRAKARVFWWILCICCACARSSSEVLRYLFVLLDEESRGYWTADQLTMFIQLVDFQNEEHSSETEARFLAQTTFDDIESSLRSLRTNSTNSAEDLLSESAPAFRYRNFEKYLKQHPIAGSSTTEIETVFTLMHVELRHTRGRALTHRRFLVAVDAMCDQLAASDMKANRAFCLLPFPVWTSIVNTLCDFNEETQLSRRLKSDVNVVLDSTQSRTNMVADNGPTASLRLAAIPISLWIVIIAYLGRSQTPFNSEDAAPWTQQASVVDFSTSSQTADDDDTRPSLTFRGFVASVDLTIVAQDASECKIIIPQCILHHEISLQSFVHAVLTLQRLREPRQQSLGGFYGEGEVVFFKRSMDASKKIQVSQDTMLIPLESLDESGDCYRVSLQMKILLTDERSSSYVSQIAANLQPSSTVSSPVSSSSRTPRHAKRNGVNGWTKVHGLANLGNTCFMNSALQCLAATPMLREYFLKEEHLFDLSTHTVSSISAGSPFRPGRRTSKPPESTLPKSSMLPVAFGQLLSEMNSFSSRGSVSGVSDVVSPTHMRGAIATLFPHLSDGTQQDAQEFISSLLSSLSDELKRLPHVPQTPDPPPPVSSPSFLSRFSSGSRSKTESTAATGTTAESSDTVRKSILSKLRFQVTDSDGRADMVVAKEWWISHLISEPSIVTALFCGQFKSTLRCCQCGATSARFEPFSSLQLPLSDENGVTSPRKKPQHQQVIVILHFLESPCRRPSLRIVFQAGLDWTVDQLLIKLQQDHSTFSSKGSRREHVAATLNGFAIDDYIESDALISTLQSPINVFEIEAATINIKPASPRATMLNVGTNVLARASHERWVRAHIEQVDVPNKAYRVRIDEANHGNEVYLHRDDVRLATSERHLLLRFIHRRPGLVPFYATNPYRKVICGFPFFHRTNGARVTSRGLYLTVRRRFSHPDVDAGNRKAFPQFVLKRVCDDGKSCNRCEWSDQCDGCLLDPLDEERLDLEMDETIAIEWLLDAHEPVDEWLATGYCIEDHDSYVKYKTDTTFSLEKSLEILCAEEQLVARCSKCSTSTSDDTKTRLSNEAALVPHTKTLSLWSLPPILVIQLKRFELVADKGYTWQRLNHSVDFQVDDFDISRFLGSASVSLSSNEERDRDEVTRAESFLTNELQYPVETASRSVSSYRMYGVVNHMGDLGGGHYTAHVRHPDNADWWLVDDASATPANPHTLSPSSTAYLLFYVREDLDPTVEDDELEFDFEANRPVMLHDFFPRQSNTTRVTESALRSLFKQQDFWQRTVSRVADLNGGTSKSGTDTECSLM